MKKTILWIFGILAGLVVLLLVVGSLTPDNPKRSKLGQSLTAKREECGTFLAKMSATDMVTRVERGDGQFVVWFNESLWPTMKYVDKENVVTAIYCAALPGDERYDIDISVRGDRTNRELAYVYNGRMTIRSPE
jgi:hypothetical protein